MLMTRKGFGVSNIDHGKARVGVKAPVSGLVDETPFRDLPTFTNISLQFSDL